MVFEIIKMDYSFVKLFGFGLEICRSLSRSWSRKNYRVSVLVSTTSLAISKSSKTVLII